MPLVVVREIRERPALFLVLDPTLDDNPLAAFDVGDPPLCLLGCVERAAERLTLWSMGRAR